MKLSTVAACRGCRTANSMLYYSGLLCFVVVLQVSLATANNYYEVIGEHPVAYELVCPENEELRDTMPCCEPTCDNDCRNAKCSNTYVRQPTCVCSDGYVRHKGKCIRLRQCPPKPPVPPMCGENEELLPSPPSCEPTCTDDCAGRPVHSRYLDQPTCVCKKGYRRHKGKCIRVDQCPSCGPYASLTESVPCCEPTCENDCSNVLCISPIQTDEPVCVCQDGYVKHNSTCIKRELCPQTIYYLPKQYCRCGGKRKPKGRVPVKHVEVSTPAPPCNCQKQHQVYDDYYPTSTCSPPMTYPPYTTPAPPPTYPPLKYGAPPNYPPAKYAPYHHQPTYAPHPPVHYTECPTTCAPPTVPPPKPYYHPQPQYAPAPPCGYTPAPPVVASTCPPTPSYHPLPCNATPPPPPAPCNSVQHPYYPPTPPKPYTYPQTTPNPFPYPPTTPKPYYQQPPTSYQDQPYYAIPALKQCSCSINAANNGQPYSSCGRPSCNRPPISYNVATPSTTTVAPTTTTTSCPPNCRCNFCYNQYPHPYQDQPYVKMPPTTVTPLPVDVPYIPLPGPNCYNRPNCAFNAGTGGPVPVVANPPVNNAGPGGVPVASLNLNTGPGLLALGF